MKVFFKRSKPLLAAVAVSSIFASVVYAADEPFNATMSLIAPIVITETQALSFTNTVTGNALPVVTAAGDGTAATFTATGEASTGVTGSVVESNITMQHSTWSTSDATREITVDTFTLGGDMNAGTGVATFSAGGALSDLRVGATSNVEANDIAGAYAGTATFRLVY